MSKNIDYTIKLENLIINILLPAYEDYCRRYPFSPLANKNIDYSILTEIKQKKDPGALLKPKKILS
jgi:hypothetical protein